MDSLFVFSNDDVDKVLAELIDVEDEVREWSEDSADFVDDMVRRRESRPDLDTSEKQMKWLCRIHAKFVDADGIGQEILDQ